MAEGSAAAAVAVTRSGRPVGAAAGLGKQPRQTQPRLAVVVAVAVVVVGPAVAGDEPVVAGDEPAVAAVDGELPPLLPPAADDADASPRRAAAPMPRPTPTREIHRPDGVDISVASRGFPPAMATRI